MIQEFPLLCQVFYKNHTAFNVAVFAPAKSSESLITNLIGNLG